MNEKEKKKFYNSKKWKKKRLDILRRDCYECQDCIERLRQAVKDNVSLSVEDRMIRTACEVHHIKELSDRPDLALCDENLISLCIKCHNIRHGRTVKVFAKRRKKPVSEEQW